MPCAMPGHGKRVEKPQGQWRSHDNGILADYGARYLVTTCFVQVKVLILP